MLTKKEILDKTQWASSVVWARTIQIDEFNQRMGRARGLTTKLKLSAMFLSQKYDIVIRAHQYPYAKSIAEECRQIMRNINVPFKSIKPEEPTFPYNQNRNPNSILLIDNSVRDC